MAFHSPDDLLSKVLHVSTVSSHVAGMLASGDLKIIVGAVGNLAAKDAGRIRSAF